MATWPRRYATCGLVVFVVALIVRVLYVITIRDASFVTHLQTEPAHYDEWARAIVAGNAPVHLPFDEAPAFPYFVALIYSIAGPGAIAVALVQAVLGAAACTAMGSVARRLGGELAGWIAGGIAAVYGPFVYFTGQLEPAALAVAAVAGALAATPLGEATPRRWLLAGAAWAGTIVVRSELVLAVPFVVLHAALAQGRRAAVRAAVMPAALVALSLAANTAASGHPVVLTTGAGVNLWLGNNAAADGVNPFVHGPLEAVVAEVEGRSTDPVERDRAFRTHAVLDTGLLAKKLVWTFSRRELPNAADIPWQTAHSWVFQPPVFPLGFGLVLPLALAGIAAMRGRRRELILLAGPIAAGIATCVLFFTNARFRIILMPPLLVLAGVAVMPAVTALRRFSVDRRGALAVVVAVALGIGISWPHYFGIARFRVAQIDFNTAELEYREGHLKAAVRYLRAGLSREPDDQAAQAALAGIERQLGSSASMQRP